MSSFDLPFPTSQYDALPISAMIYVPELDGAGRRLDYRLVYGNRVFARDWLAIYGETEFVGKGLVASTLMDDYSFQMMDRFLTEPSHAFTTYMPLVNLHLHFEPMTDLPEPYYGFFMTNITDYEAQEARFHFLRNIREIQTNAVLLQRMDDGRNECVFVSESFAAMMECSVAEAKAMMDGPGLLKTTHPEDRPLIRSMLKRRVSDDGTTALTVQKLTAKKNSIWVNIHFSFIDDFGDHYIYCTYNNVTVLKEYEERLRSVYISLGNNFYQANAKTLALVRVDLNRDTIEDVKGRDPYPTDSVELGYSEAIGLRAANYLIPAEQTRFIHTFDRRTLMEGYLEGRTTIEDVLLTRRRDGTICYTRFSATLTRHPMTGDIIAFITEEECNAEKVRTTLMDKILVQQFDMVAYLVDGTYGVTIGDGTRILRGSIFPTSRFGDYERYLAGQVFPNLSGTEEEKAAAMKALSMETIAAEAQAREPYVVNIVLDMDGETFYKRFDFYTVDPDSNFYVVLKSDTTEIQKAQIARNEQLRIALDEANQANVAKTAFLSSMSHEIRTPMNAIIGLDAIALKDPDLPERTREHLTKIGASAHHLLGLINDILDMSRIESGRMVLKGEEFSFRTVMEEINTMIASQCADKGLQYDCQVRGSVDEFYIGDDMKLKQVLINILGNAVKFTSAGGTVAFTVERTAVFGDQSTLRFTIRDTGIGMDKEYLPRLFEAFSQEDATTTNRYGGSGLGMAITKNIVEMMNGTIEVESEKGVGSTFTVTVTLKNAARREGETLDEFNPEDLHVLVVDDDPIACDHAKVVLEELGIHADTCLSGREALETIRLKHARREAYNLILMDLRMPEADGIEVTRQIRDIIGSESAIVILTAYSWNDFEADAESAGVDGFMAKPLFASSVLYEFREAMRRKKALHPSEAAPAALEGRCILLAEDMLINAEIMKELLSMREILVEHAENGQLAVEMFAASPENHFDAVLMDVRMPVLDGLGATVAIRALERPDAKTVPIIAMTANAFDEDVQRSLQAGMNAHLSKPVDPDRLFDTLSQLIGAREAGCTNHQEEQ